MGVSSSYCYWVCGRLCCRNRLLQIQNNPDFQNAAKLVGFQLNKHELKKCDLEKKLNLQQQCREGVFKKYANQMLKVKQLNGQPGMERERTKLPGLKHALKTTMRKHRATKQQLDHVDRTIVSLHSAEESFTNTLFQVEEVLDKGALLEAMQKSGVNPTFTAALHAQIIKLQSGIDNNANGSADWLEAAREIDGERENGGGGQDSVTDGQIDKEIEQMLALYFEKQQQQPASTTKTELHEEEEEEEDQEENGYEHDNENDQLHTTVINMQHALEKEEEEETKNTKTTKTITSPTLNVAMPVELI